MSTMEAPSSTIRRAEATAASGSKLTPPSEKESGVTLTTPITEGRENRSRIGTTARCLHEADAPSAAGVRRAAHEQPTEAAPPKSHNQGHARAARLPGLHRAKCEALCAKPKGASP